MARRPKIDTEVKEGIGEVVKALDALIDSDFPETLAALMFKVKEELVKAGFTEEQAFQLVVAHGVQTPVK